MQQFQIENLSQSHIKVGLLALLFSFSFYACRQSQSSTVDLVNQNTIKKATTPIIIDGKADPHWNSIEWKNIDQRWIGEAYTDEDFSGRYKLSWDQNFLYVFAEIQDDTLIDQHPDGLYRYWDDDCLEVFIDENMSRGNHQYNHNAFAYHISLDGKVTDINPDSLPAYYNDHVNSKRITKNNVSYWELAIRIFDDTYKDDETNTPLILSENKNLGFAIAYCDNDSSIERENFIGSIYVEGEDKDQGWIDAGIFQPMTLTQ